MADLKLLTTDDVIKRVLKPHYWDRWKADQINNQSVANLLVDWVWGSGKHGILIPQKLLGVTPDGIVGKRTLAALNASNQAELFQKIMNARFNFIDAIIRNRPANKKFRNGWINRLNDYKYEP